MDSHISSAQYRKRKKTLRYTALLLVVFCSYYASGCFAAEVDITGVSVLESDKNTDEAVFRATLSHATEQTVSVDYIIEDGSATSHQDYSATHGTITFLPGETSQTITVTIIGDRKVEPDETFRITLTHISGDAIIGTDFATGTIIDDDIPEIAEDLSSQSQPPADSTHDNKEEIQDSSTVVTVAMHDAQPLPDESKQVTVVTNNEPPVLPVYFSEVTQTEPSTLPKPPEKGFFSSLISNIFRSQTKERVKKWYALIETYKNQDIDKKEQMERTNLFFNQLRFRSDNKHWNLEDYWATPIEMLTTNGGDCEDFSIAKFFTLRKMGIDENQMRMIYVESTLAEEPHMVLAYYPTQNSDPLILDNLMDDIKPLSERDDLFPVYSFNNHGIWIEKSKQVSIKISETNYISHWKTLKAKMEKEASNNS